MIRSMRWLSAGCTVALTSLLMGSSPVGALSSEKFVQARDDCDPTTFNAIVGPGTCVGNGLTTFNRFAQQTQLVGGAPAWFFGPRQVQLNVGETVRVDNKGGEFHTFTQVAAFGGGFVPALNQLSGAGAPRPECFADPSPDNLPLAPGGSGRTSKSSPGEFKYQCCVHPWMHAVLKVG